MKIYDLQFQGDLMFRKLTPNTDPDYVRSYLNGHKPITKPTVLHMGEGKNHGHIIDGPDVIVGEKTMAYGVERCHIMVRGSNAKVMHRDITTGKAPSDGEGHGTITLEPGLHIMKTQREGADEKQVHSVHD